MNDLAQALERSLTGELNPLGVRGRVTEALGTLLKASGVRARIGEVCELRTPDGRSLLAEVVGFCKQSALLTPFGSMQGISAATEVLAAGHAHQVAVGDALLGRVVDGFGAPIDTLGPIARTTSRPVYAEPPHPLARAVIERGFDTGIKVIDAMLRVGEGQRMGLFAPAGVGKSTLIGMLARGAASEVNVIALIGERGREVREFIERNLGTQGMAKSVVVVATSDKPAMERAKAAYVATSIAEHFRAQGKRVLLLMDSVTRFARALREIGLASGEPPTRRGYPPSIFAALPQLLERTGLAAQGSITAFYAALTEGEDSEDPIAEEVMSLLDGHIMLTRKLAALGQYPAVDVLVSLSRVMPAVADGAQRRAALKLHSLLAKHQEIELLLKLGEYQPGSDALADEAIKKFDAVKRFFAQEAQQLCPARESLATLLRLAGA